MNSADSNYDHNAPGAGSPPPSWAYIGPFTDNEQRKIAQATEVAMLSNAEIQEIVRPPLPQVVLFRPRFGYPTGQPGIMDVVEVDRQVRVSDDFSGGPGAYSGAPHNIQGNW
jgi:hypothetical protein